MSLTKNSENMEYPKLDPEFKAKWTAALRSGEYKQGKDKMYNSDDDSYCCLGVAGAVCGSTKQRMDTGYFSNHDTLPVPGGYPNLLLSNADLRGTLMTMNDTEENTFSQIADWIDANL